MLNLSEVQVPVALLGRFLAAWVSTWALCHAGNAFSFGRDRAEGVQKFHVKPTSRLGGVAIAVGLCTGAGALALLVPNSDFTVHTLWFLLACAPV